MSLKGFLVFVALTDILAWGAWNMLRTSTNPESGVVIVGLFYASLLLALLGLFAVIGFAVRIYMYKRDELILLYVKRTFRQSFCLSALVVISLGLSHASLLRWWVVLIVIAVLGVWEQWRSSLEIGTIKKHV